MFGNCLADEYALLESELGFTHDDIKSVILDSIDTSWLTTERQHDLVDRFRREFELIESAGGGL
jgi:hypothetical protein